VVPILIDVKIELERTSAKKHQRNGTEGRPWTRFEIEQMLITHLLKKKFKSLISCVFSVYNHCECIKNLIEIKPWGQKIII
jgi:hypothetical protein